MTFKILDNYLPKEDFKSIKDTLFPQDLTSKDKFQWNYRRGIVRDPDLNPTGYDEYDWMYYKILYQNTNILYFDKKFNIVEPILKKINPKKILIIRANILMPTPHHIYHEFHVDQKNMHKVALFYVTTNNGFTILRDQPKINCVENRMLLFDGSIEHHSVTSTDFPRCVFNINYL